VPKENKESCGVKTSGVKEFSYHTLHLLSAKNAGGTPMRLKRELVVLKPARELEIRFQDV
jgi:hypothetical protein